jgi:transcription elongation GreA/GreB family factor
MKLFKEKVFAYCLEHVDELIASYRNNLRDLNESAANETKSTAGDKHETALAMLQIEQKNIQARLEEVTNRKHLLENFKQITPSGRITNGSLVKTTRGYFLLTVALGKLQVDGETVIAISAASPLGTNMWGLQINDSFEFKGLHYVIEDIV